MRAAAIQLNSTEDTARNLETADRLVREAAAAGATFVVLPEKWPILGTPEQLIAGAQTLDGAAASWASSIAAELGIDLVAGSFTERTDDDALRFNTCVHASPAGQQAVYRKLHLFDVEVDGTVYRESDTESAGEELVLTRLVDGTSVGLTICYDLRFPELYRALAVQGARILTVPAAFTLATTRDHWAVLLRARAIENACFVVAANQIGEHPPGNRSGGRSMIVDPWGVVLAQAPDTEGFAIANLDLAAQDAVRKRLPALEHRRPDVYGQVPVTG